MAADQIGVWLDSDVKREFEELAYRRRSSMSEVARELVVKEVEQARQSGELDSSNESIAHS